MTTPTHGRKRPWYLRLPRNLSTAVTVVSLAEEVPDGFTRQVTATFSMNEPGKGSGPGASQRSVIIKCNPADARRLGLSMVTRAQEAEHQNRYHGNGDQYGPHQWAADPSVEPPTRRCAIDREYAAELVTLAEVAATRLDTWRQDHPNIGDYRVEDAYRALRRAERLLTYLRDDMDPPGDAARAALNTHPLFAEDASGGEEEPRG